MSEARDPRKLEPYYSLWVDKMTGDNLHEKSDIAKELAYQSKKIASLLSEQAYLKVRLREMEDRVNRACSDNLTYLKEVCELKNEIDRLELDSMVKM